MFARKVVQRRGKAVLGAVLLAEEGTILEATEAVAGAMQQQGVTKKELARRLGVSKAAVTQMLGRGVGLRSLGRYAHALGCRVEIHLRREK